jgi:hypothetical protein
LFCVQVLLLLAAVTCFFYPLWESRAMILSLITMKKLTAADRGSLPVSEIAQVRIYP